MTSQAPIPSDEVPAPPIGPSGQDQIKLGGAVIGQFMSGRNRLSPNATLESQNFETGVAGFQLTGAGAAEFGDMTVRGDIAGATLVGTLKTSTTGNRIEVYDNGGAGRVDLYAGVASETPAFINNSTSGGSPALTMVNGYVGGSGQTIAMLDGATNRRDVRIDPGVSSGVTGWLELGYTNPGRVFARQREIAPVKNISDTATGTFNNTLLGGNISYGSGTPKLYCITETRTGNTDANGHITFTLSDSGFANGLLSLTATIVQGWAAVGIPTPAAGAPVFLIIDHDGCTAGQVAFWVYDTAGAAVAVAGVAISYTAYGW